ncbi:MAG TPA: hypothetical protein VM733_09550 [Thermoanaerobaculia bacterium]|nr:hypothetical protein [Thermoanaerobaculia bacterium]
MLMGGNYYSLTLNAANTDQNAYYSLQPAPGLQFLQGGFTFGPKVAAASSVTIYPQVAQLQIPASNNIAGGVTIVTGNNAIAGALNVSPAQNVPVTVTLYGAGGVVIGTATLQPGETHLNFGWDVSAAQAIPASQAREQLDAAVAQL